MEENKYEITRGNVENSTSSVVIGDDEEKKGRKKSKPQRSFPLYSIESARKLSYAGRSTC